MYWLPAYDQLLIIRGRALISKNIARVPNRKTFCVCEQPAHYLDISIWAFEYCQERKIEEKEDFCAGNTVDKELNSRLSWSEN